MPPELPPIRISAQPLPLPIRVTDRLIVFREGDPLAYVVPVSELHGVRFAEPHDIVITGTGPYALPHAWDGASLTVSADGAELKRSDYSISPGSNQLSVTAGVAAGYTALIVNYTY